MGALAGSSVSILRVAPPTTSRAQEHLGHFADDQSADYWGTKGRALAGFRA